MDLITDPGRLGLTHGYHFGGFTTSAGRCCDDNDANRPLTMHRTTRPTIMFRHRSQYGDWNEAMPMAVAG